MVYMLIVYRFTISCTRKVITLQFLKNHAYLSRRTDIEEGQVGLGWFEARFRVSEIPHVNAKEGCVRTGQPKNDRCSRNNYKGLGAPTMWSRCQPHLLCDSQALILQS